MIDPLTREQVWRGLAYRTENPLPFVMGLDACVILERGENWLARELRFGEVRIRDRVTLLPMQSVRYQTEAGAGVPASSLVISIEEPGVEQLAVRFEYTSDRHSGDAQQDAFYDAFLKNAYTEADIDTVRTIRQLLAEGAI